MNPTEKGPLATYAAAFENLDRESLPCLLALFHPDAHFRDPFNDVRDVAAIGRIFDHMFEQLEAPRFRVLEQVPGEDGVAWLRWVFACRLGGRELEIEGASRVTFGADGRVVEHLDYWDPAGQLYARLPLIGPVVRWLGRRLSAAD